ncbi:similar to flavin-nucleotide-binding protein [Plenodomus lingam JN3]|uniref:Similar to flavin-nucleotide-binding protein n=2 Tax=Leptosphaeria maculans TaxID=5022 RepID=E5AAA7_LEPMJ|nr:similar to flavin-nucleotide-binding protein [Plenodomus lingam JN3]CBY00598.1 similar to flavin-nucleotide-binding protein [Plenodomus lingam JN3]
MLGCTGNFENQEADPALEPQDLYLHGYVSGRMFRRGREAGGDAEGEEGERGLPMTVAASFLDGLVLSLTPFHNSCNYRSAIAHGYAHPVTSPTESLYALRLITDSLLPSRWSSSRTPPTPAELSSTGLLRIRIVSASAKVRVGGPKEDRKDLKNEELVASTWTGVVPFWGTWGDPVTAEGSGRGVEGYVEEWRVEETEKAREYAVEAVGMKGK